MRIRQARWQRKLFLLFHLNKLERVITTSLKWGHGDKERRENNIWGRESFLAWRSRIFFSKAAASRDQKRCCLSSNRYSSDVGMCVCVCVSASWFMHKYACVYVCLGVFVVSLIDISSSPAVWNAEMQLPCRTNGIWTRVWVCTHTSWQWQIESFEVLTALVTQC